MDIKEQLMGELRPLVGDNIALIRQVMWMKLYGAGNQRIAAIPPLSKKEAEEKLRVFNASFEELEIRVLSRMVEISADLLTQNKGKIQPIPENKGAIGYLSVDVNFDVNR